MKKYVAILGSLVLLIMAKEAFRSLDKVTLRGRSC